MELDSLLEQVHRVLLGGGPRRPSALRDWPGILAAASEGAQGRAQEALVQLQGDVARFAASDASVAVGLYGDLAECIEALRIELATWRPEERTLSRSDPVGDGRQDRQGSDLDAALAAAQKVPVEGGVDTTTGTGVTASVAPAVGEAGSLEAEVSDTEAPDPELLRELHAETQELLGEATEQLHILEKEPASGEPVEALFRCFHTLKGSAGMVSWTALKRLSHAAEDLLDTIQSGIAPLDRPRLECLFSTIDVASAMVDAAVSTREVSPWTFPDDGRVERLVRRIRALEGTADGDTTARRPSALPAVPTPLPRGPSAAESDPRGRSPAGAPAPDAGRIRVDARRLDEACELIGELAIQQTRVAAALRRRDMHAARELQEPLAKLMRELQALSGSLRMQPLVATFRKMARLARDAANTAGKTVRLQVVGADTELDKSVVDRLTEPLIHLLRNAIDHGLESDAAERVAAGKAEVGTVTLRAARQGRIINVQVEDDGSGLNREGILKKAKQRGLVSEDTELTDSEVFRLICEPGFSTREEVTSLSGRGVGMNVVCRQIELMGGRLQINSKTGQGTCFSLRLPLTLAAVDGLVVRVGRARYVVAALEVQRLLSIDDTRVIRAPGGRRLLKLGEGDEPRLVPLIQLEEAFHWPLASESRAIAVLLEADDALYALAVDELLGRHNGVIRGLEPGLQTVPGISSCAILPDGDVALVLEAAGLLRQTRTARKAAARRGPEAWAASPATGAL